MKIVGLYAVVDKEDTAQKKLGEVCFFDSTSKVSYYNILSNSVSIFQTHEEFHSKVMNGFKDRRLIKI